MAASESLTAASTHATFLLDFAEALQRRVTGR